MDFGELLHTAKKNDHSKTQVQYYSTKFAPPKKHERTKTLSVNVQKFLAKKEAEEKQKRHEADERKNKLLALRSQDKKATRRVNVMLKRTKSANQSVIADALDSDNTAVTLAGPSQPDEDDYGYVSQESSALYNKMMERYSKMPDEPKFTMEKKKVSTNLNSTKDRVKAALEREKEEALLPHRRKRKHAENKDDSEKIQEQSDDAEIEKKDIPKAKPKFRPPPTLNFSDLLKLAEKKQFEPVIIEPKKEDDERPLTKKQKKEMEREKQWRERKESQNRIPQEKFTKIPKVQDSKTENIEKMPEKNLECNKVSNVSTKLIKTDKIPNKPTKIITNDERQHSSVGKLMANNQQKSTVPFTKQPFINNQKGGSLLKDSGQIKKNIQCDSIKNKQPQNLKPKQFPPSDLKSKQFPPSDLKPKQFPPSDLKPKQSSLNNNVKFAQPSSKDNRLKQLSQMGARKSYNSPTDSRNCISNDRKKKRPLLINKGRIIDDDDEEYDSEMDDFIDDEPEEGEDYSKYISEIFGYDKRRYRLDNEDDVDDMETSFSQQMKEEVISTKIGIMEDLEDIRQEEEAKKRKQLLMNKRRKK